MKPYDRPTVALNRLLAGARLAAMAVLLWQIWAFLFGGHSLIVAAALNGVPNVDSLPAAWWVFTHADVLPLQALGTLTLAVLVGLFLPFCAVSCLAVSSFDPGKALARRGNAVERPNQQAVAVHQR